MSKAKVYHCDNFYADNVCTHRGFEDLERRKLDAHGFLLRAGKPVCLSNGISTFGDKKQLCINCVEFKRRYFPSKRIYRSCGRDD